VRIITINYASGFLATEQSRHGRKDKPSKTKHVSYMGKKCIQSFLVGIPKRSGQLGRRIILIWTYMQQEGRERGVEGTHLTEDKDSY